MRALGYLPDPPDSNDWNFDAALRTLKEVALPPPTKTLRHLLDPPLDQGNIGSCVANSVAKALQCSHAKQGIANPPLASRLCIYYLARATHKMQHFDSGTFIRAAFQILNKFGFAPESMWTYDTKRFAVMPPTQLFTRAIDQSSGRKPTLYWRIHETGDARRDAIRTALANDFAVVFGTLVDSDFVDDNFGEAWVGPTESPIVGGHAMVLGGYDETSFHVLNSWGAGWGHDGWCRFRPEAIDHLSDLWIVEHAPQYSQPSQG